MYTWLSPVAVSVAGGLGGLVNATMTQNGFILPMASSGPGESGRIWRPGILGNITVSAVAALVSWGLYGAGASLQVFAEAKSTPDLTYSALVGAVLIGMGGARWLTSEVDKNLLRGAAVAAANKDPNQRLASQLAVSSPSDAFTAAVDH